jgi:hypothetical protein
VNKEPREPLEILATKEQQDSEETLEQQVRMETPGQQVKLALPGKQVLKEEQVFLGPQEQRVVLEKLVQVALLGKPDLREKLAMLVTLVLQGRPEKLVLQAQPESKDLQEIKGTMVRPEQLVLTDPQVQLEAREQLVQPEI